MLQFLILISYKTFGLHVTRGECALELDGACSGDQLFEVLKSWGIHLVVTEVVPVSGGEDEKADLISVTFTSG